MKSKEGKDWKFMDSLSRGQVKGGGAVDESSGAFPLIERDVSDGQTPRSCVREQRLSDQFEKRREDMRGPHRSMASVLSSKEGAGRRKQVKLGDPTTSASAEAEPNRERLNS